MFYSPFSCLLLPRSFLVISFPPVSCYSSHSQPSYSCTFSRSLSLTLLYFCTLSSSLCFLPSRHLSLFYCNPLIKSYSNYLSVLSSLIVYLNFSICFLFVPVFLFVSLSQIVFLIICQCQLISCSGRSPISHFSLSFSTLSHSSALFNSYFLIHTATTLLSCYLSETHTLSFLSYYRS